MKKLFSILTIIILLMFSLTACKIESASQHDARLTAESRSLAEEQESLLAAQNNETTGENEMQTVTRGETVLSSSTNTATSSYNSNSSTSVSTGTISSDSSGAETTASDSNTTASATTNGSSGSDLPYTTDTITVKLKVTCYNITQYAAENSNINASGIIYENDNLILPKGSSVFTALKKSGLPYTISGDYITSINNLAKEQYGPANDPKNVSNSGWMYRVDGVAPSAVVKGYSLNGAETIEFYYVTSPSDH